MMIMMAQAGCGLLLLPTTNSKHLFPSVSSSSSSFACRAHGFLCRSGASAAASHCQPFRHPFPVHFPTPPSYTSTTSTKITSEGSVSFGSEGLERKRTVRLLATSEEKSSAETPVQSEDLISAATNKKAQGAVAEDLELSTVMTMILNEDQRRKNDPKGAREAVKKGQTTAAVTGAIAVLLGLGYLLLVQLLDTRGINLVPPPPEAFDP